MLWYDNNYSQFIILEFKSATELYLTEQTDIIHFAYLNIDLFILATDS